MPEVAAVSSIAVTLSLVLSRPRISERYRVGPAAAAAVGVVIMFVAGLVGLADVGVAAEVLWRPLVTIAAIMVLAAVAHKLEVLHRLAVATARLAGNSTSRLFGLVFLLSALTSGILNNDAAVLLLTPLVVVLIRRLYPDQPGIVLAFAFAVFMAAGVAPLVVSNPMNMIVADVAGISFNAYALRMLPISLAGWVVTFAMLRLVFARRLSDATPTGTLSDAEPFTGAQKAVLLCVVIVVLAYPVVSYAGGPIFAVAAAGAALALVVAARSGAGRPLGLVRREVSWETLGFFVGALLLAVGLRNAGAVDGLTELYSGAGVAVIGGASALGSAVINNHPMALINLLAIDAAPDLGREAYLAALIGGDLGPRFLPIGSLAGLMWIASMRKMGMDVPIRTFAGVGAAVTVPTLAVSLAILFLIR